MPKTNRQIAFTSLPEHQRVVYKVPNLALFINHSDRKVLRGHNWVLFPHRPQCTVTLNSNLRYLKNLKLFSIGIKELFEPIALWKKKRQQGFALFKSIFLRNQSFSSARWFYGKKRKIVKGNLYLTENWLHRNKIWHAADNHSYMCHVCAKGSLDSNFN